MAVIGHTSVILEDGAEYRVAVEFYTDCHVVEERRVPGGSLWGIENTVVVSREQVAELVALLERLAQVLEGQK